MQHLIDTFEEVADWCERHLEATRGREIGMTFGAAIRAYGHPATKPEQLAGDQGKALDQKADEILLDFSKRFLVAYGWYEGKPNLLDATVQSTNVTCDPGPRR